MAVKRDRVQAQFEVDDVVSYVEHLIPAATMRLVEMALQRAVVHVGATHTLAELSGTMSADEIRSLLREQTQSTLNAVGAGLRVVDVSLLQDFKPPRYIQQTFDDYSENLQLAQLEVENARKTANETLIRAAGEYWSDIAQLIEQYEREWELGEPEATQTMDRINAFFDSDRVAGKAFNRISAARGYLADIDTSLGMEARRFEALLDAYREHPQLVIAERWMEARNAVMGQQDVETMYVPHDLGSMAIDLSGLQTVKDIRRKLTMERREMNSLFEGLDMVESTMQRIDEMKQVGKAGRQLKVDSTGRRRARMKKKP